MPPFSSPTPSSSSSGRFSDVSYDISDGALPFRSSSLSDFEIERLSKQSSPASRKSHPRRADSDQDAESTFRIKVSKLIAAKSRRSTVSGRIPLDPSALVLFFRSQSGITHSLDFPIDVDYDIPPALDVLVAACLSNHKSDLDFSSPSGISLFYPTQLPLTTTLELANHPILEAVRNALFPALPVGHYLTAIRDKLEVMSNGGHLAPQSHALRNDGRVATLIVTLPVRFSGGALLIRDSKRGEEKYYGRGGKFGDIEWAAFSNECEYEVETVQKGMKMTISYGIHLRTFGPTTDPLITPSDYFFGILSPVLNTCRGRKIAFYLTQEYGADPSHILAESLVPRLKGGDSILYHAIKLYHLNPELHWAAGGYIWPVDTTINCKQDVSACQRSLGTERENGVPPITSGICNAHSNVEESTRMQKDEMEILRKRVEESGGISFYDAEILILTDQSIESVAKEKVTLVCNSELEKLVINVLLVVFVP